MFNEVLLYDYISHFNTNDNSSLEWKTALICRPVKQFCLLHLPFVFVIVLFFFYTLKHPTQVYPLHLTSSFLIYLNIKETIITKTCIKVTKHSFILILDIPVPVVSIFVLVFPLLGSLPILRQRVLY